MTSRHADGCPPSAKRSPRRGLRCAAAWLVLPVLSLAVGAGPIALHAQVEDEDPPLAAPDRESTDDNAPAPVDPSDSPNPTSDSSGDPNPNLTTTAEPLRAPGLNTASIASILADPRARETTGGVLAERTGDGTWYVLLDRGGTIANTILSLGAPALSPEDVGQHRVARVDATVSWLRVHLGLDEGDRLLQLGTMPLRDAESLVAAAERLAGRYDVRVVWADPDQIRRTRVIVHRLPGAGEERVRLRPGQSVESLALAYYGRAHFARMIRRANAIAEGAPAPLGSMVVLPFHPARQPLPTAVGDTHWMLPAFVHQRVFGDWGALIGSLGLAPTVLPDGVGGMLVTAPSLSAPLFAFGLVPGDVIVGIGGLATREANELFDVVEQVREQRVVQIDVRRGDRRVTFSYLLLPAPAAELLAPPAVLATPERFGAVREPEVEAALREAAAEADADIAETIAWTMPAAQQRFLATNIRGIAREAQVRPASQVDPATGLVVAFEGMEVGAVAQDTLLYAYGLRTGDVVEAVQVDRRGWVAVGTLADLLRQFPLGRSFETALVRINRQDAGIVWLHLRSVDTPAGVAPVDTPPAANLPLAGDTPALPTPLTAPEPPVPPAPDASTDDEAREQ